MKKLLSLLASLGLTAVAGLGVVACTVTIPSSAVSVDKDGNATFSAKLHIDKDTIADVKGNTITFRDYEKKFAILPDGNYKKGDELKNPVSVDSITSYADSFTTNKIHDGKMSQGLDVKATIKFKVSQPEGQSKFKVALVKTDDQKTVSSFIEYIEIKVNGSVSHPGISNAKLSDDRTTITLDVKDIKATGDVTGKVTIDKITDITSATIDGKTLTIKLTKAIDKSYDEQTFKITYKDEAKEYTTKLTVPGVNKPAFSSADYNGTTITVSGSNFDNFVPEFTKDKLSILSADKTKLEFTDAEVKGDTISITLGSAIEPTYQDQIFTISYALTDTDKTDTTFTVKKIASPEFDSASYSLQDKTITIKGSHLDDFPGADKKPVAANFSIDSKAGVTISDASVTDANTITIALSDYIKQYKADANYSISYEDTTVKLLAETSVKVEGTSLGKANYTEGSTTITVSGKNLGNFDNLQDKVKVDGSTVTDAKTTGENLVITIDKAIEAGYGEAKTVNVSYELTGGDTLTSSFTVAAKGVPAFSSAEYDQSNKTIVISGSNISDIEGFDAKNLSIEKSADNKESGIEINDASVDADKNTITVNLKTIANRFSTDENFNIVYTDSKLPSPLKAQFTVNKTTLDAASIHFDGQQKITIAGTNLGTDAITNDKVVISPALEVGSVSTTDKELTINLKDNIPASYSETIYKVTYTLNSGDQLDGGSFKNDVTAKPAFDSVTSDNDKIITVKGTNLDKFLPSFDQTKVKTTAGEVKSAAVKGTDEIDIELKDSIKQFKDSKDYTVSYDDSTIGITPKTFTVPATTFKSNTATYDDKANTLTIAGSNLGSTVSGIVSIDNGATVKNSAIKDDNLVITLSEPLPKDYDSKTYTVSYKLTGGDTLTASYTKSGDAKPTISNGTYSYADKTISFDIANGTNFITPFDYSKLSIDSAAGVSATKDSVVNGNKLVIKLDKNIKQFTTSKDYKITYDDGKLKMDGSVSVGATKFNDKDAASFTGDTITINGQGFGVNASIDKANISLSGIDGVTVKSVSSTDTVLTIKTDKAIPKKWQAQTLNISYKLTGGESLTTTLNVNGSDALAPTLGAVTYKEHATTMEIVATNIDQISWEASKFSISDSTVTVSAVDAKTAGKLTLTLNGEIAEQATEKTYKVSYKYSDGKTFTSTEFKVKQLPTLDATASISGSSITVNGHGLIDATDAKATVTGLPEGITVSSSAISNNILTITLSGPVNAVYWTDYNLSISVTNDKVNLTSSVSVQKNGKVPSFTSASYAPNSITITVNGTNLDQIKTWDSSKFTGIDASNIKSATSNETTLTITLNNAIVPDTTKEITLGYNDGHNTSLSAKFTAYAKGTLSVANLASDGMSITATATNFADTADAKATVSNATVSSSSINGGTLTIKLGTKIEKEYWETQTFTISVTDPNYKTTVTTDLSVEKDIAAPKLTSAEGKNGIDISITGENLSKLGTLAASNFTIDGKAIQGNISSSSDTGIVIKLSAALDSGQHSIVLTDSHKLTYTVQFTVDETANLSASYYNQKTNLKVTVSNMDKLTNTNSLTDNKNWKIVAPDKESYSVTTAAIDGNFVNLTLNKAINTVKVASQDNNGKASLLNAKVTITFTDPTNKKSSSVDDNLPEADWKTSLTDKQVCSYEIYDGSKAKIIIKGTNLVNVDWSAKDNWKFNGDMGGTEADPMNANDQENVSDIIGIKVIDSNTIEIDITDHSGSFSTTLPTFGIQYTDSKGNVYRTVYKNVSYQDPANGSFAA